MPRWDEPWMSSQAHPRHAASQSLRARGTATTCRQWLRTIILCCALSIGCILAALITYQSITVGRPAPATAYRHRLWLGDSHLTQQGQPVTFIVLGSANALAWANSQRLEAAWQQQHDAVQLPAHTYNNTHAQLPAPYRVLHRTSISTSNNHTSPGTSSDGQAAPTRSKTSGDSPVSAATSKLASLFSSLKKGAGIGNVLDLPTLPAQDPALTTNTSLVVPPLLPEPPGWHAARHARIRTILASLLSDARALQPCWQPPGSSTPGAPAHSTANSSVGCTRGQRVDFRLALHAAAHASTRHYIAAPKGHTYAHVGDPAEKVAQLAPPHPPRLTPGALRLLPSLAQLLGQVAVMGEGVDCRWDPTLPHLPAVQQMLHNSSIFWADSEALASAEASVAQQSQRFLIAFNVRSAQRVMPWYLMQMLALATYFPAGTALVSGYESSSTDTTPQWLELMQGLLDLAGVPSRIVAKGGIERQPGEERIAFLARVRNAALSPLNNGTEYQAALARADMAMSNDEEVAGGFPADRIIFVNDVFFCWQDMLRLVHRNADLACGVDLDRPLQPWQMTWAKAMTEVDTRGPKARAAAAALGMQLTHQEEVEMGLWDKKVDPEDEAGNQENEAGNENQQGAAPQERPNTLLKFTSRVRAGGSSFSAGARSHKAGRQLQSAVLDLSTSDHPWFRPAYVYQGQPSTCSRCSGPHASRQQRQLQQAAQQDSLAEAGAHGSPHWSVRTISGTGPGRVAIGDEETAPLPSPAAHQRQHQQQQAPTPEAHPLVDTEAIVLKVIEEAGMGSSSSDEGSEQEPVEIVDQESIPWGFYDIWVARDIQGHMFEKGYGGSVVEEPQGAERLAAGYPFPVQCCWNGAAVLNAAPFRAAAGTPAAQTSGSAGETDKAGAAGGKAAAAVAAMTTPPSNATGTTLGTPQDSSALQFRAGGAWPSDCYASECSLLCNDLWRRGHRHMVVDPTVRATYEPWTRESLHDQLWGGVPMRQWKELHGTPGSQEGLEQAWTEVQPPEAVECCPIGVGQDWVAFNLCHMRSEWMGSTTTSTDGGEPGAAGEPASGTEQVSP